MNTIQPSRRFTAPPAEQKFSGTVVVLAKQGICVEMVEDLAEAREAVLARAELNRHLRRRCASTRHRQARSAAKEANANRGAVRRAAGRFGERGPHPSRFVQSFGCPGCAVSYEAHVKRLFREADRAAMLSRFDLWSYDDVKANAEAILGQLADGKMPCDGAWPNEQVELFRAWIADGAPA